ncbi:MAG: DUF4352 domain-containing protein [Thermomicrobiales bacterium]|nr:DUF4352 domain-containing protein [Thermomicrobiales bacterium]
MQRTAGVVSPLLLSILVILSLTLSTATAAASLRDFGNLVPIYDETGASIGQVSIYGIYDPFEIVESGNDLQAGTHHVLIEAGFFNTGSVPLSYDPDGLLLIDTNGFAYTRVMVNNLTASSTNYFGQAGAVEPGTDFYGDNAYVVPDGAVIERVVYSTGNNHISAYDARTGTNPVGTDVVLSDLAGLPLGRVGVVSITDPFEAYDSANPPAAGTRYVAVEVIVANQGSGAIAVAASDFRVIDELGRLTEMAAVTPADSALLPLEDGDIQPGGITQGILVFQLPEASSIAQVTYADAGVRDQVIADLEVAASISDSTGGCAGFVDWAVNVLGSSGGVGSYLQNLEGANPEALDAGMLSIFYQDAAYLLEQQQNAVPPPAVESANTFVIEEFLVPVTTSLETLMNAVAGGDYVTAQTALDELSARLALFSPGGEGEAVLMGMQTACPDEWEELTNMGG